MKQNDLRQTLDRRRFDRRPTQVPAAFRKIEERKVHALMLNCSDHGAYFVSDDPPPKGSFVEVKSGSSEASVGKVAYVRQMGDVSGFGVEFFKSAKQSNDTDAGAKTEAPCSLKADGLREEAFEYYDRLKRVRDFVTEHLSENVPLTRAAKIATLEKTYFSSFFHQKVGITYRQWLQYVRVKEAMEQISATNCSITEAGLACGFQDLRTFERAFKKWTSMVPRDYKKLVSR